MENLFFNGMLSNMLITLLIIIISIFGIVKLIEWIHSDDEDSKKAVTKSNDYDD